jgi:hypothetical protein
MRAWITRVVSAGSTAPIRIQLRREHTLVEPADGRCGGRRVRRVRTPASQVHSRYATETLYFDTKVATNPPAAVAMSSGWAATNSAR